MRIEERLREAELAFLNAPFRENGWLEALERLGAATACTRFQLVGYGGPLGEALNLVSDPPRDTHGHMNSAEVLGPSNWRLGTLRRPLELSWERDYAAFRAANDTAFYDDACSDLDGHLGCQTALINDRHSMIGLVMVRTRREGPCDGEILERFRRVAVHAQRAARVHLALGQEAAELMIEGPLAQRQATLLLDRYGQLLALTRAAESLVERGTILRLSGLTVSLVHSGENRALGKALRRMLGSEPPPQGPLLHEARVGRCPSDPSGGWQLLLTRLPASDPLGLGAQLAMTLRPLS